MRRIATLLLLAAAALSHKAFAGHWTIAQSPIIISGDAMLADWGQTLTIDPGVEVIITGPYQLKVRGVIRSLGTSEDPIIFRIQDTTGWSNAATSAGGRRGIRFDPGGGNPGNDLFQWTYISDMKGHGILGSRKVTFNNCKISHSRAGQIVQLSPGDSGMVMTNTQVYDNICDWNIVSLTGGSAAKPVVLSGNRFHHNRNGNVLQANLVVMDLKDNEFDHNETAGIGASAINIAGYTVNVLRNKIHHNHSDAVAPLHASMGKILIEGNLVCNNTQDGAYACGHTDGGSGMHLAHNNSGTFENTEYIVRNNVIANNYSNYMGGGLYIYSCKIWVSNNTIVNNKSKYMGSAILTFGNPQLRFKNNIIYGNRSEYTGDDTTVQVKISGGTYLHFNNNFLEKPLHQSIVKQMGPSPVPYSGDTTKNYFGNNPGLIGATMTNNAQENAVQSDFGITAGSPCINRGDSAAARLGSLDYAQNSRFNGKPDIGAFERTGNVGIEAPGTVTLISPLQAWPNPVRDVLRINLPAAGGQLSLTDLSGKTVLQNSPAGTYTELMLAGIAPGLYQLRWTGADGAAASAKVQVR